MVKFPVKINFRISLVDNILHLFKFKDLQKYQNCRNIIRYNFVVIDAMRSRQPSNFATIPAIVYLSVCRRPVL